MSLFEKLSKIQALVERTSSEGERQAATLAMQRLLKRQEQLPVEIHCTAPNIWQKKTFCGIVSQV